jgi:hypothetical protein
LPPPRATFFFLAGIFPPVFAFRRSLWLSERQSGGAIEEPLSGMSGEKAKIELDIRGRGAALRETG